MATLTWLLDVNAPNAAKTFDEIKLRVEQLDANLKKTREVTVGDRNAMATFAKLELQANRFGDKIHNMPLTIEGAAKAEAQLLGLEATADRLNEKLSGARVGRGGIARALISAGAARALLPVGGGSGAAVGGAVRGIPVDLLASPAGIGAGAATLATLAPVIDALTGFGVGAIGAGGAFKAVQKFQPAVLAPGLSNISRTLSTVTQSIGPSVGLMMVQLGKFVQGLAPTLAKLFASTLPFMRSFLSFAMQSAKIALPALIQVMNQMVKSGALTAMTQGFVILVQGLAGFIKEMGPGFKAGALIFRAVAIGIRTLLYGLGAVFGWLGKITGKLITDIRYDWDSLRHNTAVIFDALRRSIATTWGTIYSNTIGQVVKLYKTVTGWFAKLPGSIKSVLGGLGKMLLGIATGSMNSFLAGLKSVGGSILSWIKNFFAGIPKAILSLLHMSPPHPGSVFFDLGANMMHHLEAGMKARLGSIGGIAGRIGGVFSHLGGSGVPRWAPLVLQVLKMLGQPSGALGIVLSQIATESGGNPRAINLWDINAQHGDPSRGLLQVIGSTFNAYAGPFRSRGIYDPLANVFAGLNYAIHRYGRTGWMSVLGHGHGYASGGLITEPIFGIGASGRAYTFGERGPETVIPGRGSRGPLLHIDNFNSYDATDPVLLGQRLSFAITAASLGS